MPAISIVLPSYNGSRYIRQSIESCLTQTFTDFELLVVNDCSTDNTASIVEEYAAKDNRVKLINNQFNKKLPLSLNTGFEKAQGKYFTWTSDDNIYAPQALEVMYRELESDQKIDLVYCDYTLIDEDGKETGIRKFGDVTKSFINWLGAGACFLYKSEIHKANNGYNPGAFLIEDYDFFVRAFLKFNFKYIPRTDLYYYREHGASLTATQSSAINDISKIFLERNLPGLEKKLGKEELVLIYRKLAVHNAVARNNSTAYLSYLQKVGSISFKQKVITAFYVIFKKILFAFTIGLKGIGGLFKQKSST